MFTIEAACHGALPPASNKNSLLDRQLVKELLVPDRHGRRWQLCPAGTQKGSTR